MNPVAKSLNVEAVRSTVYTFASAGDVLPMHEHTADTAHLTAVMRGSVVCRGPDGAWERTLEWPSIHRLPPGAHEIEALEPDTMIWNVVMAAPLR